MEDFSEFVASCDRDIHVSKSQKVNCWWLIDEDGVMLHIDLLPMRVLSALAFLSACANLYLHQTICTPVIFNNKSNWPPLIQHGTIPFPVPSNSILRFLPFICVSGCGCAWPTELASSYLLGLCHQTLLLVSAAWYMNTAMSLWRPRGTPTRYQCDLRGVLWSLTAAAVQGQKMWCQTRGWLQKAFQHRLKWLGKKNNTKTSLWDCYWWMKTTGYQRLFELFHLY